MKDYLKDKVVWSGLRGGSKDEPYHIIYIYPSRIKSCWCPPEAIPHLESIGIRVKESTVYGSGFQALGCSFHYGFKKMDDISNFNKYFKNELTKFNN